MERKTGKAMHYYRILYATIGWTAFVLSYIFMLNGVHHTYGPFQGMFNTLKLFTMQTNLLVLLWATMAVRNKMFGERNLLDKPILRGAIAVYITVTGIVFLTLLRVDYREEGIRNIIHIISHYFIPLAYIIDWLLTEKRGVYRLKYILYWLVYPLAYGAVYLVYGLLSGNYAYPFIDIENVGYVIFARNIFLLVLFFMALSLIYILVNKRLLKYKKKVA